MSGLHIVPGPADEGPGRPTDTASAPGPAPDPLADLLRQSLSKATTAPVPRDLVPETLAALRDVRQARPGFRLAGLTAAAAVLIVGIGLALLGFHATTAPSTPGASPSLPSSATPAASSAVAVGPDGFPTEAFGLPVLSIAEATSQLDPARGAVVVAVKGYLSAGHFAQPIFCSMIPAGTERLSSCGLIRWFTSSPQQATTNDQGEVAGPTGASLSPVFPWPNQLPVLDVPIGSAPALGSAPKPAVLVGHVDDPIASRCGGPVTGCARRFVVDAVAWVDGAAAAPYRGTDVSSGPVVVSPPARIEAGGSSPGSVILYPTALPWRVVESGPSASAAIAEASVVGSVPGFTPLASIAVAGDRLASYDPRLPGSDAELAAPAVTWLVRGWEAGPDGVPRLATYAVPDAMVTTVIRVTDNGLVDVPPAGGSGRTADGLPIISVATAVQIRDDPGRTSPDQLAVAGWYQPAGVVPCPVPPSAPPALAPACPDSMAALMADPEVLRQVNPDGSGSWHAPTGAYITPRFLTGNPGTLPRIGSTTGPVLAVLVGHFHDAAAADCDAADRRTCEQQFVVERVEPMARAGLPPANDWRLSCQKAACDAAAAAVAIADPLSYADAERVALVDRCAPWMRCLPDPASTVVLAPTGWAGDPAALEAWEVPPGADPGGLAGPATPFTGTLTDSMLAEAAGYTVTCAGPIGPDCYQAAVAAARRDGDPLEITDVHITDGCGSGWLRRANGSGTGWEVDCAQPNAPSSSSSPSP